MAVVGYEVHGPAAVITLDRPERRNAVDGEVARALEAAIDRVEADPAVRVAILTAVVEGERPVFCAGHDLRADADGDGDGAVTERGGFAGIVRRERDTPLVAAVDGLATAGGFEIVLACDVVVASTRASFAMAEAKWNLVAGGGGLFRLTRIVGRPVALDLLLTGDPLSAERAHELGLVSRLAPPGGADELAMEVATRIAAHGPQAVRLSRQVATAAEVIDDETAWRRSAEAYRTVAASQDAVEGRRAFAERRPPRFEDR